MALFMGICWAIASGYINKHVAHHFNSMKILEFCLICFTILCTLIVFPENIYVVILILGLCVILGGLAWPICTSVISNQAPQEIQGKILGLSQSIQSLSMTLAPILGGLAFHVSLQFPFLIAGLTSLLAAILYYFILKHH